MGRAVFSLLPLIRCLSVGGHSSFLILPLIPPSFCRLSSSLMSLPDSSNKDFFKALLDEVSNCLDQNFENPSKDDDLLASTGASSSSTELAAKGASESKKREERKATVLQIASNVLNIKNGESPGTSLVERRVAYRHHLPLISLPVAQNRTEDEVFKAVSNMGRENAHLEVREERNKTPDILGAAQ